MTQRRSTFITPSWLHTAGSAQANCADQSLQTLNTTVPPRDISLSDRKGCGLRGSCPMKNAIWSAITAVASAVSELSP